MGTEKVKQHIYIIKQRKRINLASGPFEYEELLGKCTSTEEAKKILDAHPDAYISEDSTYSDSDLFRYE
ncbi:MULTISPECIES: hypothetical protein [Sulfurimonas]|uniref:Uncharacterized protein n=1 Tax=Sulfurimonas diazotrophicus TaxID=3131939 RepID=A0ABZ3HD21_9BACT